MIRVSLLLVLAVGLCWVSNGATSTPSVEEPRTPLEDLAIAALWSAVDVSWHQGELSRCVEIMEGILALDPTDLEAYADAAWLLWSAGREEEAVAMYSRATQALPERYESWFEFGMYCRQHLKDNQKAIEMYLKAIKCDPHPNLVERQLAHAYEDVGRIADARKVWESLGARFPEDGAIQFNLNLFRQKHGL